MGTCGHLWRDDQEWPIQVAECRKEEWQYRTSAMNLKLSTDGVLVLRTPVHDMHVMRTTGSTVPGK